MRNITSLLIGLLALAAGPNVQAESGDSRWADVIARSVPSVVSLQVAYTRDFVEADQGVSSATGFIVDAERGIILTNRHVVGSGPVDITATFQNLERIDVVPLYRDPVHDFGFLRYNPADLARNSPVALELNPDGARVGVDVRVIGSDGGEQLSILAGTIARLDRRAPNYGRYGHNDFNTFYMQAASSTSGGSSGSPVLDSNGSVIALNAAANSSTASSFFLPLDRVQYALEKLQASEPVSRGTVQTVFEHHPYRFLQRLGLTQEAAARTQQLFPDSNGMLLVRQVLPGGVAEGLFEEGDILLEVQSQPVAKFVRLAEIMDAAIGQDLEFRVLRQGQPLTVTIPVSDLHTLQPASLVELGGSVLHDLSLQRARGMNMPQSGVMVAKSGYEFSRAGIPSNAVLTELDGEPLTSVEQLLEHLRNATANQRWTLRYKVPGREYTSSVARVTVNDQWFRARQCEHRDDARFWDCVDVELPAAVPDSQVLSNVVLPEYRDALVNAVAPSLVRLSYDIPYAVDNVHARSFKGVGLIVDATRGLIATDRNTVPISLGDLEITFFSTYKVPGRVVFLHPTHNIALLQYDPALLGDIEITAPTLATSFPKIDADLELVGYRNDGTVRRQAVSNVSEVTLYFQTPRLARFQQVPVDVLSATSAGPTLGGALLDDQQIVQAVWQSFAYQDGDEVKESEWAMPAVLIGDALQQYLSPEPHYLAPALFEYQSLDKAREAGLDDSWIRQISSSGSEHRRAIAVRTVAGGAANNLRVGDVILQVNGELPGDLRRIGQLFNTPQSSVKVLRDAVELDLTVSAIEADALGTRKALLWAGSLVQDPHFELAFQRGNTTPGVFISSTLTGSPSIQDKLYRNRYIVAVEGQPVTSLEEFAASLTSREQDQPVRLTVVSMNGYRSVVSVEPETGFWPTTMLQYEDGTWQREILSQSGSVVGQ